MLTLAVALVVGYFVIQSAGYVVHKALHQPQLGKIHGTHEIHHKEIYPPEDYLFAGKYKEVPAAAQPVWYYLPPAILMVAGFFYVLPAYIAVSLTAELALVAWMNDWLHQKLHIKGHWLERFSWFHHLRALHWHHHVDDSKNIGIFSWFTDKLLGTYQEPLTRPSYLPSGKPKLYLIPLDTTDEVEQNIPNSHEEAEQIELTNS